MVSERRVIGRIQQAKTCEMTRDEAEALETDKVG
jgi:hypothetical protein